MGRQTRGKRDGPSGLPQRAGVGADLTPIGSHAWGKLERPSPDAWPVAYLSLTDHAADVAAVFAALIAIPSLRAKLAHLAGAEITDDQQAAMIGAAFLHDIGKANLGFWRKQRPKGERGGGPIAGHLAEVGPLLFRPAGGHRISIPEGGSFLVPATPAGKLLLAALGHHGAPLPQASLELEAHRCLPLWRPAEDYDPVAEARSLCAALAAWLPGSLLAVERMSPLPDSALHGFAGLLSLADWIASNTDEGFFPFGPGPGYPNGKASLVPPPTRGWPRNGA